MSQLLFIVSQDAGIPWMIFLMADKLKSISKFELETSIKTLY